MKQENENIHPNDSSVNNDNDHYDKDKEKLDSNTNQTKEKKQNNNQSNNSKKNNQKQDKVQGGDSKEDKKQDNKQDPKQDKIGNEHNQEPNDQNKEPKVSEVAQVKKNKLYDEISVKGGTLKKHCEKNLGIVNYENKDTYNGHIDIRHYNKEGFGEYIFKNGDLYLGIFKNDEYDKYGRFIYKEAEIFTEFYDCKPVFGIIYYKGDNKNSSYIGNINEIFEPNRYGEYRENGLLILGEFEKGIKTDCIEIETKKVQADEVQYISKYSNENYDYIIISHKNEKIINDSDENALGSINEENINFVGQINNEEKEGYGYFVSEDKNIEYIGEFEKNMFNGYGIAKYSNGSEYEGHFENNLRKGLGKLVFKNGEIYVGEFDNDEISGYGKYSILINNDSISYEGRFNKSMFDHSGILTFNNGKTIKTNLREGIITGITNISS